VTRNRSSVCAAVAGAVADAAVDAVVAKACKMHADV